MRFYGLLFISILLTTSVLFAQPWIDNELQTSSNEFDYHQLINSFDNYWSDKTPSRGTGYKQFRRWQWFMETRLDNDGNFNHTALWQAWQEKQQMFSYTDELDEADWQAMGPYLPRNYYVGGMGRLNCIAFHPTNSDIMYVGAASGGVWKTLDHGETWAPLTDHLPLLGVSAIAVHPEHPDTIYVGTGDGDGSATYSIGVIKSYDGGETWDTTGLSWGVMDFQMITALKINPDDPDILIACSPNGIYRTTDGADNWTLVHNGNSFKDLDVNPDDSNIWFATRSSTGVYRSTDAGVSWVMITNGLPTTNFGRIALAISPVNSQNIFAIYSRNNSTFYRFYRSTDGGDSWEMMSDSPNILGYDPQGGDNSGQAWYDLAIAADPTDENSVFIGGINIWKSEDGGANWILKGHWVGSGGAELVHADVHGLDFNGNNLYATHDGGINVSEDFGDTWPNISSGLVITQIYRLGVYAGSDEVEMAMNGNQDNGSNLYNDGTWTSELGGDGMECAIDPSNSNYMYGEYYYGDMSRSIDGGQTWEPCNEGSQSNGAWVTPFMIHPQMPSILYKVTRSFYVSYDRAITWEQYGNEFNGNAMTSLASPRSNMNIIYTADRGQFMFRSYEAGLSWDNIALPVNNVTYMQADPWDPYKLYITIGGYNNNNKVFVTENGGNSWYNISQGLPNMPINCIAINPQNTNHLYVGAEIGVFFSPDGGQTWQDYSDGMPNVIVNELEIHENSNTLVAATYGRGMWSTPAVDITLFEVPTNLEAVLNEADGSVTLSWEHSQATLDEFTNFVIYRDHESIGTSDVAEFEDTLPDYGDYSYTVTAVYDEGESAPSQPLVVEWIEEEIAVPENLDYTLEDLSGEVTLNWEHPENGELDEFLHFEIRRDGETVGSSTTGSYSEVLPGAGIFIYDVLAVYTSGTSNPSNSVEVNWAGSSVISNMTGTPAAYALSPAYPNPFNPSTTVILAMVEAGDARINVYNINGKLVKTLQNGRIGCGYHSYTFNASELSSGVYFIEAIVKGHFEQKRKIVLVK